MNVSEMSDILNMIENCETEGWNCKKFSHDNIETSYDIR